MKVCPSCHTHYPDTLRFCSQDGTALQALATTDSLIGKVAGGAYCLTERLGAGGFGAVYRAQHVRMPMVAAVKVLFANRAGDPDMVGRFQQEVAALAVLQHPNIVRVLDHGFQDDLGYYMAMEFLAGDDVGKRLDSGRRFSILEVAAILDQTLLAIDLAHRQGIIHRDVKVENIFLAQDSSHPEGFCVKLLDFGLARLTQPVLAQTGTTVSRGNYRSTASRVFGSVATMAPAGSADRQGRRCARRSVWLGRRVVRIAGWRNALFGHDHRRPAKSDDHHAAGATDQPRRWRMAAARGRRVLADVNRPQAR